MHRKQPRSGSSSKNDLLSFCRLEKQQLHYWLKKCPERNAYNKVFQNKGCNMS